MLALLSLLGQCGLWYSVHCRIARCKIPLFVLWPYLDLGFLYPACLVQECHQPVLSRSVISLSCPGVSSACLVQECHQPVLVYLPFDGLAYFCVLYSFFIVAVFPHVSSFRHQGSCCDDILDSNGLLIGLATLDVLCWIMSVMVSLMVSTSSSSWSISNRFLNSSWNSIFFDPICVAPTPCDILVINVFLSTSTSSLILLVTSLWSLPMLTWLSDDCYTSLTMSGLFVRTESIPVFVTPFGLFHGHLPISSLLSSGIWYSWFCTFLIFPILPNLPVAVSTGFVLFPIWALKYPITSRIDVVLEAI